MSRWPFVRLEEIFEIARGGSPRPIDAYFTDDSNGINWILIGDASEGSKYITKTRKRIRKEGVQRSRLVHPGDFLLSNSMSFGKPYIMGTSGCIHDGWLVLTPREENIDSDFLYHLLGSDAVYREFVRLAAGATVKNLNMHLVKGVKIPLPPIADQRRIAAILDQAEAVRNKRRQALAKLDSLAQSIFHEMFGEPSIDSPDFHPIALQDLVSKDRPISYGILMPGPDQSSGVKYVRVVDMKDGGIELTGIRSTTQAISNAFKRSLLQSGDLVLSIRGHVGRLASVPDALQNANITQDTARLAITGANPVFVREYLRTEQIQRWMKRRTKGMAVQGLNLADVKVIPMILPPPERQQVFANAVACGDQVRSSVLLACDRSEALFRSLQNRAFGAEL